MADYLAASDLFVFPSKFEGQPNALLEAMAYGLPCAVSDIPGNRSLAESDRESLYFNPDDIESAVRAMLKLLGHNDLAGHLGVAARARIEREHSLELVAGRYISLYERIMI